MAGPSQQPHGRLGTRPSSRRAFSLIELVVVMIIIVLLAGVIFPGMAAIMGTDDIEQAYYILGSQLSAARSQAILTGTYVGVHCQLANTANPFNTELDNTCFTALVWDDPNTPQRRFDLAPGFRPRKIPSRVAFGKLTSDYVSGTTYQNLSATNIQGDFTTFTIVFSPEGRLVRNIDGENVIFDSAADVFHATDATGLWDHAETGGGTGQPGVTAFTVFNVLELTTLAEAGRAVNWMNTNAAFYPISVHTGQLLPRQ